MVSFHQRSENCSLGKTWIAVITAREVSIPEITEPAKDMRHLGHHENGKHEIVRFNSRPGFGLRQRNLERMPLIKNPEHHSHEQENQEERKDDHRAQGQSFAAIGYGFTSKDALDN